MKFDNYISFAIVNGFFFGLVLAILKFDSPEMIVIWTGLVTIGFYLLITLSMSFYLMFFNFERKRLHKEHHDKTLAYFIKEFERREKMVNRVREFIHTIKMNELSEEGELSNEENSQKNEEAARD
ncbi:hypothetical protein [Helicobacter monodelphidis]|uniref:hypothetical protein n=1 Tax=Helicobacter sp. 15-1451 TaxID=2004995 RepID=UPI0015EB825D|nr:hypothetical protein [Helicobacter sp. 15-1451]